MVEAVEAPVLRVARRAVTFLLMVLVGAVGIAAVPAAAAPRQAETGSVERLYRAALARAPDGPGLAFWSEQYLTCASSLTGIADRFAASPEFQGRFGAPSNRGFVELLYRNVLGREGEAQGVAYWTAQLDAGRLTRGAVTVGFSESPEHVQRTGTAPPAPPLCVPSTVSDSVHRLYLAYLGREPEPDGERHWTLEYAGCRRSLADISQFFATSPEFTGRYGSLSHQAFVSVVYRNVLGRSGERGGVDHWTDQLRSGRLTRGAVMIGFSESAEHVARTGTTPPVPPGCTPAAPTTPTAPPAPPPPEPSVDSGSFGTVPDPGPGDTLPVGYVAPSARVVRDVEYGPLPEHRLDIHLPARSERGPVPVLVYVHSGGWVAGSREHVPEVLLRQVERAGMALVSVGYRLAREEPSGGIVDAFPAAPQDVDRAVRFVRAGAATWGLDPDRIVLSGGSAGGHLALLVAVSEDRFAAPDLPAALAATSNRPTGIVALAAPVDLFEFALQPWSHPFGRATLTTFLDCPTLVAERCDLGRLDAASPINRIIAGNRPPPAYLAYGGLDTLVSPTGQGRPLADRMRAARGDTARGPWEQSVFYDEVDTQGHNLDHSGINVRYLELWLDLLVTGAFPS